MFVEFTLLDDSKILVNLAFITAFIPLAVGMDIEVNDRNENITVKETLDQMQQMLNTRNVEGLIAAQTRAKIGIK